MPLSAFLYSGLVPIKILIGATSLASQFGPVTPAVPGISFASLVLKCSPHFDAAISAARNPFTSTSAACSISSEEPSRVITTIPLTTPAPPIVAQYFAVQPASFRIDQRLWPNGAVSGVDPSAYANTSARNDPAARNNGTNASCACCGIVRAANLISNLTLSKRSASAFSLASAARAFATAIPALASAVSFSRVAVRSRAFAASDSNADALSPARAASAWAPAARAFALAASALAPDICLPVSSWYAASAFPAAIASRLWETSDPVVIMPTAVAANAAIITDTINQKSHHSPLWPRNRVEAAAFALLIVSVIGGFTVLIFGVLALRECRTRR